MDENAAISVVENATICVDVRALICVSSSGITLPFGEMPRGYKPSFWGLIIVMAAARRRNPRSGPAHRRSGFFNRRASISLHRRNEPRLRPVAKDLTNLDICDSAGRIRRKMPRHVTALASPKVSDIFRAEVRFFL